MGADGQHSGFMLLSLPLCKTCSHTFHPGSVPLVLDQVATSRNLLLMFAYERRRDQSSSMPCLLLPVHAESINMFLCQVVQHSRQIHHTCHTPPYMYLHACHQVKQSNMTWQIPPHQSLSCP
jgi:hypothetical protein